MQIRFNQNAHVEQPPQIQACGNDDLIEALTILGTQLQSSALNAQYQALGFWLRKQNVQQFAAQLKNARPLGHVLHMAPRNIDLMFLYPVVLSLLAGNHVWARISLRGYHTLQPLLDLFQQPQFQQRLAPITRHLVLFHCEHQDTQLRTLCKQVALRLCWGRDENIEQIRQHTPIVGIDLAFGHKHALCLIAAQSVHSGNVQQLAQRFARDAFSFKQQACSAPRTLIWLGQTDEVKRAQVLFWSALSRISHENALLECVLNMQTLAVNQQVQTPFIWNEHYSRLPVSSLEHGQEQDHRGNYLFFELCIRELNALNHQLRPWHQTLTFWGMKRDFLLHWIQTENVFGIDRIEPIGCALEFSPIWDGMNLLHIMSRQTRQKIPFLSTI